MRTNSIIKNDAKVIYAQASANLEKLAEVKSNVVKEAKNMELKAGLDSLATVLSGIRSIVVAANSDGVVVPKFLDSCTCSGTTLDSVTITIKSRLKEVKKFKQVTEVKVDDDFIINAGKAYLDSAIDMYYKGEADRNIDALNAKIKEISEAAGLKATIAFDCRPENANLILNINDEVVTFNASIETALRIAELPIMQSGNEYNDLVAAKAQGELVDALKAAQTTPLIVKAQLPIVKEITGVSTKKRVVKLIRGSYHKQAKFLGSAKTGYGYVDAEYNGTRVFGIVEKGEDGQLSTVLSAFDAETCAAVDVDILTLV